MVQVKVKQGILEGEILDLVTGDGQYYSFKGVPYAAPPVGKLRFKAPEPPLPWTGVRKATEHGLMCPQQDLFSNLIRIGSSEDCLYLNVYSPNLKPDKPLPVMFFIHGGGYKSGSGNVEHYGPDFLVNHNVVLVTINYRLEAFGFLCLDTPDVPGNAGLKDQVAALKWVNENISQFGGDPKNVTVFGESAGGASTCFHILSPMSKGLFQRAIPMSGVPVCDWSLPFEPRKRAFVLGKILGFDTKDDAKLLEFLQSVPAEKLIHQDPTILSLEEVNNNILKMYHFTPVVEKDFGKNHFLTDTPWNVLRSGKINDVDVLIGYTDAEGLIGVPFFESALIAHYDRFNETFVPRDILNRVPPVKYLEIAEKIKKHYFGEKSVNNETMKEFVKYSSESVFSYNIYRFLKRFPKGSGKIYQYRLSCVSERNIYGMNKYGISGAAHLDDLMYLFDAKHAELPIDKNGKAYKMIQQTCTLFTNFAKYGNPTQTVPNVEWKQFDDNESFLDIGETLTPGNHLDNDVVDFWKSIYEYAGVPFYQ
ncbi:esterase B1 [Plodia interpunctella]|uniref:esterase B1 n=1 Tax=Plodia interpunctella TaxID=58824 RepID=UPI002367DDCC|nr:esterase B1-like [Plodia interpunctella]